MYNQEVLLHRSYPLVYNFFGILNKTAFQTPSLAHEGNLKSYTILECLGEVVLLNSCGVPGGRCSQSRECTRHLKTELSCRPIDSMKCVQIKVCPQYCENRGLRTKMRRGGRWAKDS